MNIAIILAGGTGNRVGADIPKQFIKVMGKPILAYTLEIFQNNDKINAIEVVCHKDWVEEVTCIAAIYGISKLKWTTVGGSTFQESTMNGVFHLKDKINFNDIVVISFGVSPMTTQDVIDDSIKVCEEHGNAISSEDINLCTCIKDDEYSTTKNLIRETIKGFSNPWTFKYGELCEAYETAIKQGIIDTLEPHTTSLYMALGKRLWFSKSNSMNIKITTREDLDIFEGYLLLQEKRKGQQ
ncbi:IspD/TarI family cytidylyltransferase [Holdemania massiliensis]|uniref:IspD/TarI family cytidylyltransferase n=1 Tax=Holdemania massiliensis TaxID=1468449 RepID=UPI000315393D|nr:IspD/TarI family cytidylyltransferase [Holdemania massiliensis]